MLPEDAKLRKSATLDKGRQLSVTDHFGPEDMDRPIPYNDEAFRNAAMEWVIKTKSGTSTPETYHPLHTK